MTLHALCGKAGAQLSAVALAGLMATTLGLASAAGRMPPAPALLQPPADLAADASLAATRGVPVIILFSLPGCHYCDVVRQNYLVPMQRDLPERQRPVIREVQINGGATFAGFGRDATTHAAFARRYGVRFAPTVVLLDGSGNILTPPIVGGDTTGLYGGYLDNAFGEAARKLAGNRRPETSGE